MQRWELGSGSASDRLGCLESLRLGAVARLHASRQRRGVTERDLGQLQSLPLKLAKLARFFHEPLESRAGSTGRPEARPDRCTRDRSVGPRAR